MPLEPAASADACELTDRELTDRELTDCELTDCELTDGELTDGELTDGELTDGELTDSVGPNANVNGDAIHDLGVGRQAWKPVATRKDVGSDGLHPTPGS